MLTNANDVGWAPTRNCPVSFLRFLGDIHACSHCLLLSGHLHHLFPSPAVCVCQCENLTLPLLTLLLHSILAKDEKQFTLLLCYLQAQAPASCSHFHSQVWAWRQPEDVAQAGTKLRQMPGCPAQSFPFLISSWEMLLGKEANGHCVLLPTAGAKERPDELAW